MIPFGALVDLNIDLYLCVVLVEQASESKSTHDDNNNNNNKEPADGRKRPAELSEIIVLATKALDWRWRAHESRLQSD